MKIIKGDKKIIIPGWVLYAGALLVDNIVCNLCEVVRAKNNSKISKK